MLSHFFEKARWGRDGGLGEELQERFSFGKAGPFLPRAATRRAAAGRARQATQEPYGH